MALAGFRSGGEVLLRDRLTRDARTSFRGPHPLDPDQAKARPFGGAPKLGPSRSGTRTTALLAVQSFGRPATAERLRAHCRVRFFLREGTNQVPSGARGTSNGGRQPRRPSRAAGRSFGGVGAEGLSGLLVRLGSDGQPVGASAPTDGPPRRFGATLMHRRPLGGSKPKGASGNGQAATPGPRNGLSGGARP